MTQAFKQTDIGLIPEDWELKELSQASEIIMGQSPPSSTYNSEGFGLPFYQGKTDFGNVYPTPRIWCTSPSKISEKDDILISVRAPVGPTNLSFEKSGIGRGLSAIRATENHFLYLYYYLKKIEKEIEKLGTGSTFKAINKSQLYNINIPLPPLSEQKKIAHVLSKIQQAIETQEQIIKTTQELKKALMQKLFTEGLNGEPQKQTEIGPIPESWEVVPFNAIAELKNGINFSKEQKGDKGILTIDVLNMYGRSYFVEFGNLYRVNKTINESYLLEKGDILFVRSSLKLEGVGWSSLFNGNTEPTTFCGFIIRARISNIEINKKYLTYFFRTDFARSQLISKSAKLGITNINQGNLGNVFVPLPSQKEQEEIVRVLLNLDAKLEFLTRNKETQQELFKNMLNQLMTGQIRVKDIEFKLEDEKVS